MPRRPAKRQLSTLLIQSRRVPCRARVSRLRSLAFGPKRRCDGRVSHLLPASHRATRLCPPVDRMVGGTRRVGPAVVRSCGLHQTQVPSAGCCSYHPGKGGSAGDRAAADRLDLSHLLPALWGAADEVHPRLHAVSGGGYRLRTPCWDRAVPARVLVASWGVLPVALRLGKDGVSVPRSSNPGRTGYYSRPATRVKACRVHCRACVSRLRCLVFDWCAMRKLVRPRFPVSLVFGIMIVPTGIVFGPSGAFHHHIGFGRPIFYMVWNGEDPAPGSFQLVEGYEVWFDPLRFALLFLIWLTVLAVVVIVIRAFRWDKQSFSQMKLVDQREPGAEARCQDAALPHSSGITTTVNRTSEDRIKAEPDAPAARPRD